jgi:hypothetical protein
MGLGTDANTGLPLSEPPPSKRRLQVAVLVLGIAALAFLGIWASSSPQEVVQVEEIGGPAVPVSTLPSVPLSTSVAAPDSRNVLSVTTLPAGSRDEVVPSAPPAQAIAPVVPSAASSAQPAARIRSGSSGSKSAQGSAKQSSRRHREPIKPVAAPRLDVIPNPYHD